MLAVLINFFLLSAYDALRSLCCIKAPSSHDMDRMIENSDSRIWHIFDGDSEIRNDLDIRL